MAKKTIITEEQVINHIRDPYGYLNCKKLWKPCVGKSMSISRKKTMLSRIGTTENNHFIKSVSSFK